MTTKTELDEELAILACLIADGGSRFDIEFACAVVVRDDGEWFDLTRPTDEVLAMTEEMRTKAHQQVVCAARYIELRGHLQHHPETATLIRFSEPEALH